MNQSTTIGALAAALAKAQGEMSNATKDKENPYYESKYADLTSIWAACREPLSKNGLSIIQAFGINEKGMLILETTLLHSSGEWKASIIPVVAAKPDVQSLGSAITYLRRYAIASLVGVCPDDDDGERAMPTGPDPTSPTVGGAYDNYKAPPLKPSGNPSPIKPATAKPVSQFQTREENDFFG